MTCFNRRQAIALAAAGLITPAALSQTGRDRLSLWDNSRGTQLRGAVFAQRRVYEQIDGPVFLGDGPVGAPITDAALENLVSHGANLAVLSHPGVLGERPPYAPDPDVEAHLDDLVGRCERAGLFVVIGFRSGPGRSAFTFHRDDAGSWFPASMIDEHVWQSGEAWAAWEAMWTRTAARYRARANVAGYLLMVEPNANQAAPAPQGGDLDEWDAARLARRVAGTRADWPVLAAALARAVRRADAETPILVSPDGYAHGDFTGLLDLQAVPGQVLALHDYAPRAYTHQTANAGIDFDEDELPRLSSTAPRWMVGEFGMRRWAPAAADFLRAKASQYEQAGANWAVFRWDSGWDVYEGRENGFNPLYGADPNAQSKPQFSEQSEALRELWQANLARPAPLLRR